MRLFLLLSSIIAAASALAAIPATGRCMVVHDDAVTSASVTALSVSTNRFKHTPEQRISNYTNLVTASYLYEKSYAGTSSFASTNGLDYVACKKFVDGKCSAEMARVGLHTRTSVGDIYAIHDISGHAVTVVSNDVHRIINSQR